MFWKPPVNLQYSIFHRLGCLVCLDSELISKTILLHIWLISLDER